MIRFLFILWFKRQAAKSARKNLKTDFEQVEIEEILRNYWNRYKLEKKDIKKQPTLGGNLMLHLAVMSSSFYDEMILRGYDSEFATTRYYKIAWEVYKKMGGITWKIARRKRRNDYQNLKKVTDLFRYFPFNSPSYKWREVSCEKGIVGFDCIKCPVAEYFKSKDMSEFCYDTWCSFDFPLAEMWNATLKRENSIAGGAESCKFRWHTKQND